MDQIKFYRGLRSAYNNTTQTKNAVFFAQDNGEILNNDLSFRPTAGTGLTYSNNTLNHSNSVSADTAKGDDSKTLTFGDSFTIPSVTYNALGHITSKGTTTMTMPSNPNTDTLVTLTLDSTNAARPVLLSSSTSTGTRTALMTTGVTINPSTKTVTASIFSGDLNGTATKASLDASGNVITTTYATITNVDSKIATAISSVYKPAGSVAFANLPALASSLLGNVYNVTDAFTTTSSFLEGAGKTYPAGTNVIIVLNNGSYLYDVLAGFVDLSPYRLKSDTTDSITEGSTNLYFTNARALSATNGTYLPIAGNAASATKLATTRTIWGLSFDGTGDVNGTLSITPTSGNYSEGIRVHKSNDKRATIVLCGSDNIGDEGTSSNSWSIHNTSDNNFSISRNSSDGKNGLLINQSGNVGIGTTSPSSRLSVEGDISSTGKILLGGNDTTNKGILFSYNDGRNSFHESIYSYEGHVYVDSGDNDRGFYTVMPFVAGDDRSSSYYTVTGSGFVKSGSSDSYVLTGGGGHKALSTFSNVEYIDAVVVLDLPTNSQYLMDVYSYGIQWDTTVADPVCTRIGNPLLHKSLPIQSSYKGCVANGKNIRYYLDPNNWAYKADGTASDLTGSDGDVRVHIDRFYCKSGTSGTTKWVRISPVLIDSTWLEIPEMIVDFSLSCIDRTSSKSRCICNTNTQYRGADNDTAYDTYLSTDVFRTLLGKPVTNISRETFRTYAKNNNSETLCMIYYQWIFRWNFSIEYNTLNSLDTYNANLTSDGYHQGGLGDGISIMSNWSEYNNCCPITPCGYTNSIGNFTGIKEIPSITYTSGSTTYTRPTMYAIRWRGFENPFGDAWLNLDGVVIKRDSANADSNVYATTNSSNFDDQLTNKTIIGTEIASDGWITAYDLGITGNIIPSAVGGSPTTYTCDYHWCNASFTEARTPLVGGNADHGSGDGLGCLYSILGLGLATQDVGFRTLIRL